MRITGGTLGRRLLVSPPDGRVRPTSDKVRQAIFNVLAHNSFGRGFTLEGIRVIDLFAGTGALGIEALSRGASFALFVEESAQSRAIVLRNIEAFGLTGASKVFPRDATNLGHMMPGVGGPFELAFLDPPYRKGLSARALESLSKGGWLARGALAVIEGAKDEPLDLPEGLVLLDERLYGDTRVVFAGQSIPPAEGV